MMAKSTRFVVGQDIEQLALAAGARSIGAFEWDVESGRVIWSAGSEEGLGLAPGSVTDFDSWAAYVDPDDLETIRTTISQSIAEKADRFAFRYRFQQPDGFLRSIGGSANCFYDELGQLVRAIGINIDVTELDRRDADHEDCEAPLRLLFDTNPDAMLVTDISGTIRFFSPKAEELFGYGADDVIGTNVATVVRLPPHDRWSDLCGSILSGGIFAARHASGRDIPVEIRVGEAPKGDEQLIGAFVRDISERVATDKRLSRLGAELNQLSRLTALAEMAAGLAHELNQPLAAMTNFLGAAQITLKANGSAGAIGEMIQRATEQALRAGEIFRQLRRCLTHRDVAFAIESLEETISDAAIMVALGRGQRDVRVAYELDPDAPTIFADRLQVQHVLVHILRNSVHALQLVPKDDRAITIGSVARGEAMLEIVITDTGPGIPDGVSLDGSSPFNSRKGAGEMGLGLAICRRIVEAHGGTLAIGNDRGGGARVSFTVPRIPPAEADGA